MRYAGLRESGKVLASALALCAVAMVGPASAQEKEIQITPKKVESKPAAAPAKAPAAAKAAPAGSATAKAPQAAWVKLCEKAPSVTKDKDGKEVKTEKNLCLTHHERLDGNTGMVLVSAAIREIEGQKKKSMMVMVPLGMAIPPGIRAAVYTKEQWEKASKNEKIDESQLKPFDLRFSLCHPAGCTAETEATPEILDQMAKGAGMMVLAMNAAAQPVGFPVPLDGYNEASKGPPIDNKKYAEARAALMHQIRERQVQMAEKFKEEQMKNLPMGAPGAPTVTGSTKQQAPAQKK